MFPKFGLWGGVFALLCVCAGSAQGAVIHVDANAVPGGTGASWGDALPNIQAGIDAAAPGDEVWVRTGTYAERLLLKSDLTVQGGFDGSEASPAERDIAANPTTIEGASLEAPLIRIPNAENVLFDGFIVTGGRGTGTQPGAMRVNGSQTNIIVTNTVFNDNSSDGSAGGALGLLNSAVSLVNCELSNNQGVNGGAVSAFLSFLSLNQCELVDNVASSLGGVVRADSATIQTDMSRFSNNSAQSGAAMHALGSQVLVRRSTFSANQGGAVVSDGGSLTIQESTFRLNQSSASGGAVYVEDNTSLSIRNTIFGANTSSGDGGAVYVQGGTATFLHATFADNTVNGSGGAVFLEDVSASFLNGILSGNNGVAVVKLGGGAQAGFRNCLLHQNSDGVLQDPVLGVVSDAATINAELGDASGNIDGEPRFIAPDSGNYRIAVDSDARALADLALSPETDIDGDPRPGANNTVDGGADEYTDITPPQVLAITRIGLSPTNDDSVAYQVRFSEAVTGVSETDFVFASTDFKTISGAEVSLVAGSADLWNVAVTTGTGDGTLRLDVMDDDSIVDLSGNPLGGVGVGNGDFLEGEAFEIDRTPPVVTLLGDPEVQLEVGSFYGDAGAEAVDNLDGDVTERIIGAGFVDVGTPGEYTITFTATDRAGNESADAVRTIAVRDTTPPTIILAGENPVTLEFGTPYEDPGASAFDAVDGDLTPQLVVEAPEAFEGLGSFTFRYSVSDSSGNEAVVIRVVNIVDTTAPLITILGDNPAFVEPGANYEDAGATAVDAVDGNLNDALEISGSVDTSRPGDYEIRYSATDSSGNEGSAVRLVTVLDRPDFLVTPSVQFISSFPRIVTFDVINTRPATQAWKAEIVEGAAYSQIIFGTEGVNNGVIEVGLNENGSSSRREAVIRVSPVVENGEKAALPIEVRVSQAPPAKGALGCSPGNGTPAHPWSDGVVALGLLGLLLWRAQPALFRRARA